MSWRPGELWFDTDVPWLGEADLVPAVAGAAPVRLPRFVPDPGLTASRQRRAAWSRRRRTRRARVTAVAVSPFVVVALAGLRNDRGLRLWPLAEDPPSGIVRLGTAGTRRLAHDRPTVPASADPASTAAQQIEWSHATSVGSPSSGRLIDGTQLPTAGPNWVTWNPVTDSVPNAPNRLYGNERTIHAILSVTRAYRTAHPEAPRVVVGDISRPGGGPMTDEHISHQNGLDVDIYFPRRDGALRAPRTRSQIDMALAQDLVDRFLAAGAQMIFVGPSTGLRGPGGVVVPYRGHEYHMHVRFPAP